MSLYSDVIDDIRRDVADTYRKQRDVFDGDAATTLFVLSERNVKDSSYVVTVGGTQKVENTHFTIDKDSGEVTFTTGNAPASGTDNVVVTYSYSNARDASFLDWLNEGISKYLKKLWDEFVDESTVTTTANEEEVDLSGISANIISIIDVFYKPASDAPASQDWASLRNITNVRYLRRLNKLHINPHLNNTGWPLKIYGLKSYTLGTAVSDTFGPPEKFWGVYKFEAKARYYEYLANLALRETGAVTKTESYEKPGGLFALAREMRRMAEEEVKKVRPVRPPKTIPVVVQGSHR